MRLTTFSRDGVTAAPAWDADYLDAVRELATLRICDLSIEWSTG
ncbi:hypothetical protein V1286_001154 [Bradyrhizobium algeriense]|uniref:Uncharacterized protein n=1 Tax=Bradyrhizobium algeriense TaxID=634784 RepID=A0ABU8B564_9BRAD